MTRTVPQAITAVQTPVAPKPAKEPALVPDEAIDHALEAPFLAAIQGAPQSKIERLDAARVAAAAEPAKEPEPVKPAETEPEPTPEPEPEVTNPGEPEVELEPEVHETPETPVEEIPASEAAAVEAKLPKRIKAKSDEDRVIFALAVAKGISVAEATRRYDKMNAEPEPVPEVVQAVVSPAVQTLEAKKAELEAKIAEHDAQLADGGLVTAEMRKTERDYAETVSDLKLAKLEAQSEAIQTRSFEAQRNAVFTETAKAFPDLNNHESPLYLVAARLADEAASSPKHPDYEAACQADAPRYFAEKAAAKLKIKPVAAKAQSTIPTIPAKTNQPKPASGSRQTLPAKPAQSAEAEVEAEEAKTFSMISGNRKTQPERTALLVI